MAKGMVMDPKDNVAICIEHVNLGNIIELSDGRNLKAKDDIPPFHKIACQPITNGETIYKYGEIIGIALETIKVGQHVHVHNLGTLRSSKRSEKSE